MSDVYMLTGSTEYGLLDFYRYLLNRMYRSASRLLTAAGSSLSDQDRYNLLREAIDFQTRHMRLPARIEFYPETIDHLVYTTLIGVRDQAEDTIRLPDRLFINNTGKARKRLKTLYGRIATGKPYRSLNTDEHAYICALPCISHVEWGLVIQKGYDATNLHRDIITNHKRLNELAY